MTINSQPPPWGDDPLSEVLRDAEQNVRIAPHTLPTAYAFLKEVDGAFRLLETAIAKDSEEKLAIPRMMAVKIRSAFIASLRLGMSGQIEDTYPALRKAIEYAWYALYLAKDPAHPKRAEIWLRRDEGEDAKRQMRKEFTISKVRRTHEGIDPNGAEGMQRMYDLTISFGAHPNQLGLVSSLKKLEGQEDTLVGILHPEKFYVAAAMNVIAAVGIACIEVFGLIFPIRFKLTGLDRTLARLRREVKATFDPVLDGA